MADVQTHGLHPETEKSSLELAAGGGIGEAVAAVAAVVLSIVGLSGLLPLHMVSISAIAVGAALLLQGGATASRFSKVLAESVSGGTGARAGGETESAEVTGGIAAEAVAGITGIVLGILALLSISTLTLCSIGLIVFGGGLLLGSGATSRMSAVNSYYSPKESVRKVVREAAFVSAGGQVFVGLGGVVLGILALIGLDPLTLTLVGMLAVASSVMMSGTAIGARMLAVLHHH